MSKFLRKHYLSVISLLITILLLSPYLFTNFISYEHDTFFHLSRIEGYAQALWHLDFFPKIYPLKNGNFGYPSPIFYCDLFLLIPAIIYKLSGSLVLAYKLLVVILIYLTSLFMGITTKHFTKNKLAVILAMVLYSFATYHITDIYIRSAVGELFGMMLMPLVILAAYKLLYEKANYHLLTIVFTALLLSHILSFILACILFLGILILNYRQLNKPVLLTIFKAMGQTILLTAFFTLPILEQLFTQDLVVENYSNASLLATSTLFIGQYFQTRPNYATFSNSFLSMSVNPGLLITFLPISYFLNINLKKNSLNYYLKTLIILGYFFLIIQSSAFDYRNFTILGFLQFIWRFMMLASVLLVIPASIYALKLWQKYQQIVFSIIVTIAIGLTIFLITPQFYRTNQLTYLTSYNDIINGKIIDPYYSATYKRVELAGGDYLPQTSIDYQNWEPGLYNNQYELISTDFKVNYNQLTFNLDLPNQTIILPKTYYKGYQITIDNQKITPFLDEKTGLLAFNTGNTSGLYTLSYVKTPIQKISLLISLISLAIIIIKKLLNKTA